ncbi:DUF550 domain-containing protein [Salmonella enterica subsp. enterica]|nr:DUF550 domain-containing protein [Salmonella enterica]ECH8697397.1 DUF550 domain-containing protein [Salmonella enterica subsp. enterica]ECT8341442.1 DUF550 domain-containing protein [Salmonella enterica subsp. enterica serovar Anatum]EEJ9482437.1 DUF550 domain-containing protein [Salmonella enterica subsp. enterica serovar Infantis]ECE1618491.1 DUF550 domain-containing protein [Salmonella enterica]
MKFTKEQLIARVRENIRALECFPAQNIPQMDLALAQIALASLTAEPVAWRLVDSPESSVTVTDNEKMAAIWKRNGRNVQPLYSTAHGSADAVGMVVSEGRQPSAHNPESRIFEVLVESGYEPVPGDKLYAAPPASERERIRREHAEWSDKTFGDVGPVGPLKHLSKEALETAAEPGDLSEWADMQFLLWDAQRRAGITDKQITRAMVEKLAVNKKREWPEPKDGEPRLHIKEQPAPVVPEEITADGIIGMHECGFVEGWNACRAALLQGGQPVSNRDELQVIGWLRSDYNSDDKRDPNAPLFMLGRNDPSETWGVKYIPLSGNSPVTPDSWISCSEQMPEDEQEVIVHNKLGYRYVSYFDEHSGLFFDMRGGNQMNCIEHILVTHWMPLPAPPKK